MFLNGWSLFRFVSLRYWVFSTHPITFIFFRKRVCQEDFYSSNLSSGSYCPFKLLQLRFWVFSIPKNRCFFFLQNISHLQSQLNSVFSFILWQQFFSNDTFLFLHLFFDGTVQPILFQELITTTIYLWLFVHFKINLINPYTKYDLCNIRQFCCKNKPFQDDSPKTFS